MHVPGASSVLRISTVYGLRGPTSRYSASKGCVYLGRNRGTETRAVHCRVRPGRRCQRHVTSAPPFRPPRSGGRRASARLEELGAAKIEGCCGGRITTRDLLKGRCGVTRTASIFGGSLLVNLFECYSSLFVISDGV